MKVIILYKRKKFSSRNIDLALGLTQNWRRRSGNAVAFLLFFFSFFFCLIFFVSEKFMEFSILRPPH